jgi:hypothetical protein
MSEEKENDDFSSRSKQAKKDDEKWERAEKILSTVRSGWSLSIYRTKPSWCSSFLEKIDLDDDEPVDMEYLIQEWGGQILVVRLHDEQGKYRGAATVKLMAYPVRHHGKRLRRSDLLDDDFEQYKENQTTPPTPQNPYQHPTPQNPGAEMMNLLGLMQKARKEDLSLLQMIYQSNGARQPPPQGPSTKSALREMVEMGNTYKQLQSVFGQNQPAAAGGEQPQTDEMAILGTVGDIVKSIYNKPQQVNVQGAAPRVVPPAGQQQNGAQQQETADQKKVSSDFEISSAMSQMRPEHMTDILLTSLSKMPDDQKAAVFNEISKRTGLQIYQQESEEEGDAEYEEERQPTGPSTPHSV